VAVRVEAATNWQSMFGLAMSMASGVWGGYGFIYIPRGSGNLHPALARILSAYDPDYLVDAWCTRGEIEAIEPGWHASHIKGWPVGPDESAAWLVDHFIDGELIREDLSDDLGGNLCSPFYEQEGRQAHAGVVNAKRGRAAHPDYSAWQHPPSNLRGSGRARPFADASAGIAGRISRQAVTAAWPPC
jgi:hypothetical protein